MTRKAPDFVWVLTADDFCKGDFNGPNGTHCLAGWFRETFSDTTIEFRAGNELFILCGFILAIFNDTEPLAKSAKVWNQATANLGYTEGNPEKPRKESSLWDLDPH